MSIVADSIRRGFEQGSRQPEGPARAYLLVVDRAPEAVQKALRAA